MRIEIYKELDFFNINTRKIFLFQEHRDLEARIAQIIQNTEATKPKSFKPKKKDKSAFQTRPYNEHEEGVMDDEELHSLLGV